jgi:hypothetical protein
MSFGYVAALVLLAVAWLVFFLMGDAILAGLVLLSALVIRTY